MTTLKSIVDYFEYLHKHNAVYLWGANGDIITKKLTDKLYRLYGSKTYDKDYYETKLMDGLGKMGADCSGAFYKVSCFDTTAQGYYDKCKVKDSILKMPKDMPCQVFKRSLTGKITHIGMYLGNGYTIEMKSSKDNCVKQKLNPLRWTHYGIPGWVSNPYPIPTRTIYKGVKGEDVKWLQWELDIDVDGSCGKQTDEAIRKFQSIRGLVVDGRCGGKTRLELLKR